MEEKENKERHREEIFSRAVRAGKRTYFFDVKTTRQDDYYLTITESKKIFSGEEGKFHFEKHKLFLYKEDFQKFSEGLNVVMEFINNGSKLIPETPTETVSDNFSDVTFEDLKDEQMESSEEEKSE